MAKIVFLYFLLCVTLAVCKIEKSHELWSNLNKLFGFHLDIGIKSSSLQHDFITEWQKSKSCEPLCQYNSQEDIETNLPENINLLKNGKIIKSLETQNEKKLHKEITPSKPIVKTARQKKQLFKVTRSEINFQQILEHAIIKTDNLDKVGYKEHVQHRSNPKNQLKTPISDSEHGVTSRKLTPNSYAQTLKKTNKPLETPVDHKNWKAKKNLPSKPMKETKIRYEPFVSDYERREIYFNVKSTKLENDLEMEPKVKLDSLESNNDQPTKVARCTGVNVPSPRQKPRSLDGQQITHPEIRCVGKQDLFLVLKGETNKTHTKIGGGKPGLLHVHTGGNESNETLPGISGEDKPNLLPVHRDHIKMNESHPRIDGRDKPGLLHVHKGGIGTNETRPGISGAGKPDLLPGHRDHTKKNETHPRIDGKNKPGFLHVHKGGIESNETHPRISGASKPDVLPVHWDHTKKNESHPRIDGKDEPGLLHVHTVGIGTNETLPGSSGAGKPDLLPVHSDHTKKNESHPRFDGKDKPGLLHVRMGGIETNEIHPGISGEGKPDFLPVHRDHTKKNESHPRVDVKKNLTQKNRAEIGNLDYDEDLKDFAAFRTLIFGESLNPKNQYKVKLAKFRFSGDEDGFKSSKLNANVSLRNYGHPNLTGGEHSFYGQNLGVRNIDLKGSGIAFNQQPESEEAIVKNK